MLEVRIRRQLPGFQLDVEFTAGDERVVLFGPSGAGKSLTLQCIAGIARPDAGRIVSGSRVLYDSASGVRLPPQTRNVGYVPQRYALFPHLTVDENIGYGLRGVPRAERRRRVAELVALMGLTGLERRRPAQLSGGQQQRVALARALVYSPGILLLDEPLSNLDAKLRNSMRVELKRLQERVSVTVLFVTHDQIEAMSLSNRLAVMNLGRIEQIGSPQQVYEHPQTPFVEDFLGRVVRFRGTVVDTSWKGLLVELDGVGARIEVERDESLAPGQRVLVAIRPEDLELERRSENSLTCAVERILYLGSECEVLVRAGDTLFTLAVPRSRSTGIGSSIDLHLPPEHLRVWEAETAAALTDGDGALGSDEPLEALSAGPVAGVPGPVLQ